MPERRHHGGAINNERHDLIILLTNDDGIRAPGLTALKAALEGLGDLRVVAPETEQSGMSHAFSIKGPLRVSEVSLEDGLNGYAVRGTPVDAVKVAVRALLPELPGLVVSGINQGENSGVDLLYSGTVAGALEAAQLGIPAIALSLASKSYNDFSVAAEFARNITRRVMETGLEPGVVLNVNIPPLPTAEIKGVRITAQGDSFYEESLEKRDENGEVNYYWTRWRKSLNGGGDGSDVHVIREGYISITPIHARLTAADLIPKLQEWDLG